MKARTWGVTCAGLLLAATSVAAQASSVALGRDGDRGLSALLDRPAQLLVQDVNLAIALTRLSEASGVPVAFSPSLVGADRRRVECDCGEVTVRAALDRMLERSPFAYKEMRGEVLVYFVDPAPVPRDSRGIVRSAAFASVMPGGFLPRLQRADQVGLVQGATMDAVTGRPLSNVQVTIDGTSLGTVSDGNGRFLIRNVPAGERVIRALLIGYRVQEQSITVLADEAVTVNLLLTETAVQLEGIVVTALGIERQERSLTTSVQQLRAEDIAQVPDPNLVAALSGKTSGVSIFNSNTPGGSSRIVIRGANSLTGGNQPLFVIDGVPVSNSVGAGVFGSRGYAAIDYGNAISDLNPNDIESISILKGPNAAALYGSRAANGVILITTKSGRTALPGMNMVASNTITFETPLKLPSYQNLYGQGYNGRFEYVDGRGNGVYDDYDESWGPRLDVGLTIPQFHSGGQPAPWVSHPNNVRDFFETGLSRNTSASFSVATDNTSLRLSVTNFEQEGMLPGFKLERTTVGLNVAGGLTDRLRVQGSAQYFNIDGANRPAQGYSSDNVMFGYVWFGRQVDTRLLKSRLYNPDGSQYNWNSIWNNNPYWTTLVNQNWDTRDRVVGSVVLTYQLNSWLSAMGRTGTDYYQDHRKRIFAAGTFGQSGVDANGAFAEGNVFRQETNSDLLLTAVAKPVGHLTFSANVGASRRDGDYRSNSLSVRNLVIPGLYDQANAAVTPSLDSWIERTRTNSVYAAGQVGYRDVLFLDVTGRNDWSSTLPAENNSYFYPSVSTALIVSDLLSMPGVTYGKLRGSWAAVGNDAAPYQLVDPYVASDPFGGVPRFSASTRLRNFDLKPERTEAWELGGELRFLDDRLGADVTYYHKRTSNQIVPAQISALTGFTSRMVNAGTIRNSGWELLGHATPVRLGNGFRWEVTGTFSKNNSMVEELYGDLEQIVLDEYYGVQVVAKKGEPYGQLYGRLYDRDPEGNVVVSGVNGRPLNVAANPFGALGNYNADWAAGLGNRFSYGPVSMNVLFDMRQGGSIYSVQTRYGYRSGVLIETLEGREQADANGVPITPAEGGGLIVPGVIRTVTGNDTVYTVNDRRISAQDYWKNLSGIAEPFVFDASFIKLREVHIGYRVPTTLTNRLRLARADVALIGRNLLLWSDVPHIDPETALNAGNAQGFEYGQSPTGRSIGFSVTVTPGGPRLPVAFPQD